ncbi:hypothetical protein [Methylocaldum gracile]|jgi:hypothetical protein|uniref:hypothetical protein n=1 Tax=Methylocaldum sp. 0917 TaxID=2485163 RepID=UPI00105F82A1
MTRRRKTPRDIVIDMLTRWGEHEALGLYAAAAERSILGRIRDGGSHPPCGGGRPLPPGIWIPGDVMEMGRVLAHLRGHYHCGNRYYDVLWRKFVNQESISGDARERMYERAVNRVVEIWLSGVCRIEKNMGSNTCGASFRL